MSPGTPNPMIVIQRIIGTPRMTSVYRVAKSLSGYRAGERTFRAKAISRPSARMHGVQIRKIWMSYQKRPGSFGNVSRNVLPSRNDARTLSHPGIIGTSSTSSAIATTVLTVAITVLRRR
ncbi:unannotated protein [freshwater metagenome]|uniref:Unannotated protein n=1 Tax=freshwater metagenome TaxID=449393 RepID=A0A6J6ZP00_9ZZZZ